MVGAALISLLLWRIVDSQPKPLPPLRLAAHINLLNAFQDGEIVRTTDVLEAGTQRGQFQTQEAERRLGQGAVGMLSNPHGSPPYAWLVGRRPAFSLDILQPQDRQLSVQVANGTSQPQRVVLVFNGEELAHADLPVTTSVSGGATSLLLAEVSATLQRRGSNRVELVFERTEMRQLMGEVVPLPLAGILTTVRFAPTGQLQEPIRPAPPAGLMTVGEGAEARSALEVPPGTSARLALELPTASRVVLRFRLTAIGAPTELSVLTDDGRRLRLHTFQPSDSVPRDAEFDLTAWAGKPVLLEIWARDAEARSLRMERAAVLVPEGEAQPPERPPLDVHKPATPPSFLVVTLDALARRVISERINGESITPQFDELVRRGAVFTEATAPASYTLASVGSLLTGQGPQTHGVVMVEDQKGVQRLRSDTPRLAQLLRNEGWRTAAFMTNPNTAARHGFAEGFEVYEELFANPSLWNEGVAGAHLPARLADWLAQLDDGEPFLAWVHAFEPHAPYSAPPDLVERFVEPYEGSVTGSRAWIDAYKFGQAVVDQAGWTHLRQLYAARVALADRVLGELVATLEASGRAGQTVIAVVSDHGESLGEHGALEHGDLVYGHQVDVALVLCVPGRAPAFLRGPATLTDLAPTLLRMAGLAAPADMEGIDLFSPHRDASRGLLARSSARLPVFSWTRKGLRLIVDTATRRRELYDLARDPLESRNLIEQRPVTAALLYQELCRAICEAEANGAPAERAEPSDPELSEQLGAIGYVEQGTAAHATELDLCTALRGPLRRQ
ncbi:MAG: sulfatase-like hydrolase/transferase [Planctomycetota bacterium]